jgi:serine/threonine protein kinase
MFDAWVGRSIGGRYVVQHKIGAGASGAVYMGRDAVLGERVAIKIVDLEDAPSSKAARSQLERVEREVQAAASMSHPHLVRFVDFVDLGQHHAGIITDFVEGETLSAIMDREGPLPVERAIDIAVQVAMGIGAMHSRHIIHRDLKPANIIVDQLPGQGDYCQVIDFGIVRYEDEAARTNAFLGTPLYASPEQALDGDVDHRADIYSLGVILFEMLTGRPPFDEKKPFTALMAHARKAPPTLAQAASGRHFEPWLESLIADLLAKSPDERPSTMADLAGRLRARKGGQAVDVPDMAALVGDPDHETLVFLNDDSDVVQSLRCPDGSARPIWDVDTQVTAIALGSETILVGTARGTVEQFSLATETANTLFETPRSDSVTSVAISTEGSIVAGTSTGRVYLNEEKSPGSWKRLPGGAAVSAVAISSESGAVVVSREDGTSQIYVRERSLSKPAVRIEHEQKVEHIEFSDDGFLIGAKKRGGELHIYSIANGVKLTEEQACPYSASPDRAACSRIGECPLTGATN